MADGVTVASEWAECRAVISRFDGYLQDYRKFSFGLITVLFTASAFLTQSKDLQLPLEGKTAIGIAVMALVLALFGLDRYAWALLSGAAERAIDIESAGSTDGKSVTEAINRTAIASLSGYTIPVLYVLLVVAAAGLAVTSLSAPFCSTSGSGTAAVTTCLPLKTAAEVWAQLGVASTPSPNGIWAARFLLSAAVLLTLVYRWRHADFIHDHRNTSVGRAVCWLSLFAFVAGMVLSLWHMTTEESLARIIMLAAQLAVAAILGYFLFTSAICGSESAKPRNVDVWPTLTDVRLWPAGANRVRLTLSGRNLGAPIAPYGVLVDDQRVNNVDDLDWDDTAVSFVIGRDNPATGNPWGRHDRPRFGLFKNDTPLPTTSVPFQFDDALWTFLRS